MDHNANPTSARLKAYALRIIRLCNSLPNNNVGWNLSKQLLRSGTSIGANYRESQRASSRKHFVAILEIALREADETQWWLELIEESNTIEAKLLVDIKRESEEVIRILAAAVKTAKRPERE